MSYRKLLLQRNAQLSAKVDEYNMLLDEIYEDEETRQRLGIKGIDVLGESSSEYGWQR